jgi:hypothetical protein
VILPRRKKDSRASRERRDSKEMPGTEGTARVPLSGTLDGLRGFFRRTAIPVAISRGFAAAVEGFPRLMVVPDPPESWGLFLRRPANCGRRRSRWSSSGRPRSCGCHHDSGSSPGKSVCPMLFGWTPKVTLISGENVLQTDGRQEPAQIVRQAHAANETDGTLPQIVDVHPSPRSRGESVLSRYEPQPGTVRARVEAILAS